MREIFDFLLELLEMFFKAFLGIFENFFRLFNFMRYATVFSKYGDKLNFGQWLLAVFFMILILAFIAAAIYLIVYYVRKFIRYRKSNIIPEDLVEEVANLRLDLAKVTKEKDRILSMQLDKLGLPQQQLLALKNAVEESEEEIGDNDSRFYKLKEIDKKFEYFIEPMYDDHLTLEEICNRFRDFACYELGLFYDIKIIRLFVAAFSTTRLIILQGISGTGKTSLPYAFGKFIQNDSTVAPVQPSWRDRTELFGYFNEFTKRFNETEVLRAMYEATFSEDVYVTILDEMNIARIEYYFAEMLSIFEMPSRDSWIVDLTPSGWDSDPKHIVKGRFKLPENMWFVGTANNDDSTFAISDKVYDRAIPINIDTKGVKFDAPPTESIKLNYKHLEEMFAKAAVEHKVSAETLAKIDELDNFVIEHFRLAFGNRIVKQLAEFIPTYVACGATELEGVDYVLANKIFRKFEGLNLSFIRDEFDGLIAYLDKLFGEDTMQESIAYIKRLKKLF